MAIIPSAEERLINWHGTEKINFDTFLDESVKIQKSFKHVNIDELAAKPMFMDNNRQLTLSRKGRANLHTDVSEYAFTQVCNLIGVPAPYMKKCYDDGMDELVDINIRKQLAKRQEREKSPFAGKVALVSDGVCEAIVSDRYSFDFQTPEILETIKKNMPGNYVPNQAYQSKSRMYIRYIDAENPEYVNGEKMTVGFTVGTSDIGKSALQVNFFIYKFACTNGIVWIKNGGTLYRQKHIGEPFDAVNIQRFKDAFGDIKYLRDNAMDEIANAQKRMVSVDEMHRIIDAGKNLSISESCRNKIIDLAETRYGKTKWGLINGITEAAQDYSLDERIDFETWAGKLLATAI